MSGCCITMRVKGGAAEAACLLYYLRLPEAKCRLRTGLGAAYVYGACLRPERGMRMILRDHRTRTHESAAGDCRPVQQSAAVGGYADDSGGADACAVAVRIVRAIRRTMLRCARAGIRTDIPRRNSAPCPTSGCRVSSAVRRVGWDCGVAVRDRSAARRT